MRQKKTGIEEGHAEKPRTPSRLQPANREIGDPRKSGKPQPLIVEEKASGRPANTAGKTRATDAEFKSPLGL